MSKYSDNLFKVPTFHIRDILIKFYLLRHFDLKTNAIENELDRTTSTTTLHKVICFEKAIQWEKLASFNN